MTTTEPSGDETAIEAHGLIGNMRSAALVSFGGDLDFLCYPEFDSPTVFAAILDRERGGSFSIRPEHDGFHAAPTYVPDTNVLTTRFLANDATAELTDFMPLGDGVGHVVMRRLEVLEGTMAFRLVCAPRFDYARAAHAVESTAETRVVFTPAATGLAALELQSTVALGAAGGDAVAAFVLRKGEQACFLFGEPGPLMSADELRAHVTARLASTCDRWQAWAGISTYRGRWRELVMRSALVLKLLTSARHGSIVAAPTFGLPEQIGGERNWDYRYTWLRDASFSLYALSRLGYVAEGRDFRHWLKNRLSLDHGAAPLQTMYAADGRKDLVEIELPHLRGHRGSRPVRVGNAAYRQLQLDIHGELFDAVYLASKYGDGIPYEAWEHMKAALGWLAEHWRDPDEGIWEVRGGRREFLHSRVMSWVAFDRALRLAHKRSLAGPLDWIARERDAVVRDIHESFWNEERGAFVQFKGSTAVDASALLMPLMRFISPADHRWLSTLDVIDRELTVDAFVRRYDTGSGVDGLSGSDGHFVACSFWFVEALARSGQLDRAHALFEKLASHANPLGLYAEELSPRGEHLGNFPQALSHLALISAATYLDRRLSSERQPPWS